MTDTPYGSFDQEYRRVMDLIRSDKTLFDADAAARLGRYHAFVRDWLNTRKAGPAFES